MVPTSRVGGDGGTRPALSRVGARPERPFGSLLRGLEGKSAAPALSRHDSTGPRLAARRIAQHAGPPWHRHASVKDFHGLIRTSASVFSLAARVERRDVGRPT